MNDNRRRRANRREREHGIEEELRLRRDGDPQERQIEAFAPAGEVGQRVDDLAQHFGDDETRNCEVVAAQVQDRTTKQGGEEKRGEARRTPGNNHRRAVILQNAGGVGAETEKCRRRKRRIAGKSADEIPGLRHDRVHAHGRGERGGNSC